jgi:fermentation-respiration switch protein FrsA (DUF1100 family)
MRKARLVIPLVLVAASVTGVGLALPRLKALAFIARVADRPGIATRLAKLAAGRVQIEPPFDLATRHGPMAAQLYRPEGSVRRTTLLIPGVHKDGIREQRLVGLAQALAASGLAVVAVAPPALTHYRITAESTDQLEDAIAWAAKRPDLAPDGRVGITGFSFAGGLALVAAGREHVRDRVAFAFSFGGYADLRRVLRYLCLGTTPPLPSPDELGALATGGQAIHIPKPHDYGTVVTLLNLADRVVPADQVAALTQAITVFLEASSIDRVSPSRAAAAFDRAKQLGHALPEPSRTLMGYVNDRSVDKLGQALAPLLDHLMLPDALSPERSPPPAAPVFLLHGADDSVVPASEMIALVRDLRPATQVRAFASRLVSHAEANRSAAWSEMWQLAGFWADLFSR